MSKIEKEFKDLIREKIIPYLIENNYQLIYDNSTIDSDSLKSMIFRLEFTGKNKIKIFNDDWRDYTEYFQLHINGKEELIININEINDINIALDMLKNKINL